ncbi:MAG: hypothetical protein AAF961_11265, partial [Planctomycetota bacterium]
AADLMRRAAEARRRQETERRESAALGVASEATMRRPQAGDAAASRRNPYNPSASRRDNADGDSPSRTTRQPYRPSTRSVWGTQQTRTQRQADALEQFARSRNTQPPAWQRRSPAAAADSARGRPSTPARRSYRPTSQTELRRPDATMGRNSASTQRRSYAPPPRGNQQIRVRGGGSAGAIGGGRGTRPANRN